MVLQMDVAVSQQLHRYRDKWSAAMIDPSTLSLSRHVTSIWIKAKSKESTQEPSDWQREDTSTSFSSLKFQSRL
ncbi:hypothetical protein chiPu_0003619 [Chiloscyllium punctatum]|uniref:Uncharacterized protein n=1 Tax=Chiloscyllium punctatum TaxID=137246 RepID=A0A401S4A0_CHIPU|nr:hypothetical protein [Chiloscyllium punctatum]